MTTFLESPLYRRLSPTQVVRFDPATDTYDVLPLKGTPELVPIVPKRLRMSVARLNPQQKRQLKFRRAVLAAMFSFQAAAHKAGDPEAAAPYLDELAKLLDDPAAYKRMRMSWAPAQTKRNTVKAVGSGMDANRVLYGKAAAAALRAQEARGGRSGSEHREHVQRSEEAARAVLLKIHGAGDGPTTEDLQSLAHHLPALRVDKLRTARLLLGASFGGNSRRGAMVDALKEHVRKLVDGEFEVPEEQTQESALENEQDNARIGADVPEPEPTVQNGLEIGSKASGGTGLQSGEQLREHAEAASGEAVPGTGEGTARDGGLRGVSASEDGGGSGDDVESGGRGDRLSGGEGTDAGGPAAETARRGGSADGMGEGRRGGGLDGRERAIPNPTPVQESLAEQPSFRNPTDVTAPVDFRYTDRDFIKHGLKTKFLDNIAAVRTMRAIADEGRTTATPEEKEILSRFFGWGQFKGIFNTYGDDGFDYEEHNKWKKERELLQELLTDDEWASARKSVNNAHFTHPDVVDAHWKIAQRLGFKGGKFLETSAGIGYYLGMMPGGIAGNTRATAIEYEKGTGKMLKTLYPASNVQVQGFEEHQAPDNFYDLIASNVPFGNYKLHEKKYNKFNANIHDHFFLKSADLVRPGGLIMHITSTGTLDKPDAKIRNELAKQLELVGALRFPGGAHKQNAGTEVVTDMLIFRKRLPGEAPGDRSWLETTTVPDPAGGEAIPVNKYFADHPEQILGTLDRTGSMYQGESMNVSRTDDYDERLQAAIDRLPQGIMSAAVAPAARFAPEAMPAPGSVKDGGFHVKGGKVYRREGGGSVEHKEQRKGDAERIVAQLGVRDAMRAVINAELAGSEAVDERAKLNAVYDAFVKLHGPLSTRQNRQAILGDPDAYPLLALEKYDKDTKTATKADMFSKRTIGSTAKVEKADTIDGALGVSLHESGKVDIAHMAKLTGHQAAHIERELTKAGIAFEDPGQGWKPADQYLSGNVREKLVSARAAAAVDPKYNANVAALEKVQPEDIDHTQITARIGASWIPPSDITAFAAHLLSAKPEHFDIGYNPSKGDWKAYWTSSGQRRIADKVEAKQVWGTQHASLMEVLRAALNNQSIKVGEKDSEGKYHLNEEATREANGKVQDMKERFKEWVWDDDDRRTRLHRFYNDNFNNIRNIAYNGQHQTFPGMNPSIRDRLFRHIPNAVWQVVTTGKGYFGHEVGMGKTYAMIASAMELRRLGLARKPAITCLKANIEAITRDALELYPGAKILSTADMFDAASRKKTISRIATGDYDLIIMTHDHMNLLGMQPEVQAKYIQDEIDELRAMKADRYKESDKKNDRIVAEIETAVKNLEAKLKKAMDPEGKDNAVYFEETGIDHLFVDEAHKYKSLPCYTQMGRMKGIPTSRSDRATNMLMRTRWLQEQNGGRGVVFASGTPIANTMGELYNLQKYLQHSDMKARGIDAFDAWARQFGDTDTRYEKAVSGEYKPVTRFSSFVNIPELMQMTRQVLDVQRIESLVKPDGTPVINRPVRHDKIVEAPKSPQVDKLMASLMKRAKDIASRGGPAQKGEDNMLKICSDGRKGAIDMRMLDANAPDDPDSKINKCVANVLGLYNAHPGTAQMIFSNTGVNPGKAGKTADEPEDDIMQDRDEEGDEPKERTLDAETGFHVYGDIIEKLVKGGIPRERIADFSKLKGAAKEAAIEGLNKGTISVAIGSTEKLGTGVNAQQRLKALHHIDVPWLPSDIEQRNGRAWRNGNQNKDILIHNYVTVGSLDEFFWQVLANKTKFIKQVVTPGESLQRVAKDEDTETLTAEQVMAAASGNPHIMEKVNVDEDVKNLTAAHGRHEREQAKFKQLHSTGSRNIEHIKNEAEERHEDANAVEPMPEFKMRVGETVYDTKSEAAAALKELFAAAQGGQQDWGPGTPLGEYRGFQLRKRGDSMYLLSPAGRMEYSGKTIDSMNYTLEGLKRRAEHADEEVVKEQARLDKLKTDIGRPFSRTEELKKKKSRQLALQHHLAGKAMPPELLAEHPDLASVSGAPEFTQPAELPDLATTEAAVRDWIEGERAQSHGHKSTDAVYKAVQPILDKIKANHTPDEIKELARRVTGKSGRTVGDNLQRLRADMTAVTRLIESQNV